MADLYCFSGLMSGEHPWFEEDFDGDSPKTQSSMHDAPSSHDVAMEPRGVGTYRPGVELHGKVPKNYEMAWS
jgi:hypothetical protein